MKSDASSPQKPILQALAGETLERPPIWIMRQAGRYLPEYRETRAQAGGFLDLCYNSDLATEVTLQPIRRYGFDAAILFADILLIPHALGQDLWFETGEGPKLTPISDIGALSEPDEIHETLSPVYETVKRLSAALPDNVTLIGFAGAPWTVATYMIAGRGTPDQGPAHALLKSDPEAFDRILDRVADATILYLSRQIEAGAEVVKIFDSWAGSLKGADFQRACIEPTRKIIDALKARHPGVPVIGFPRGAGERTEEFVTALSPDGVAIDQSLDASWARDHLQPHCAVQGNLDPSLLLGEGEGLEVEAEKVIEALGKGPFIFNLGHGVTPDVRPENVERLVRAVRG